MFCTDAPTKTKLWHGQLGHPGATILRRMIPLLEGHTLHSSDVEKIGACGACSQGKFSLRASKWRLRTELPPMLERLQGDVCGPIVPPLGPFQYFFVVADAFSQYADLSLLSTCNLVFPKLLAMLLKLRTHYPDVAVKMLRVDNADEFQSTPLRILAQHPESASRTQYCMNTTKMAWPRRTSKSCRWWHGPSYFTLGSPPQCGNMLYFTLLTS